MARLPSLLRAGRQRAPEKPFRNDLLNVERLQDHARALARQFTGEAHTRARPTHILRRLTDNHQRLLVAFRALASDVRGGQFISPAAEWLLDNFHLVEAEIRTIRANLPRRYFRQLPGASPSDGRHARVHLLALELVRHCDSRVDRHMLVHYLSAFQSVRPLTLGELWAWPSMLKLVLVENLRRMADDVLSVRAERSAADAYVSAISPSGPPPLPAHVSTAFVVQLLHRMREEEPWRHHVQEVVDAHLAVRGESSEDVVRHAHQQQAADQVSVANVMASLRLCASLDWGEYVEAVSLVDQVLRRDPAGVYAAMDFRSRDQQRRAVEELADPAGEAQLAVALRAIDNARRIAADTTAADRRAHVGYHLIGPGRRAFEVDIAYRPPLTRRLRRLVGDHPTFVYLGSVTFLTCALVALVLLWTGGDQSPTGLLTIATIALLLVPASELAIAFVQRVVSHVVGPARLPRLELKDGVPVHARTMVIVPTLLTSVEQANGLVAHLEVTALGNLDPHVHFAILSDFADAPAGMRDNDEAVLEAARVGIDTLNTQHAPDTRDRFFLFHRARQWNPSEATWMGWEHKRGKIEEFNRLLRSATDTSYTVQVGALQLLPSIRYCLTLDADTRLPRDAAKTLIGILAHPLHHAQLDESVGRVVEGYGILQPRVSVTMASAAGSLFSRVYAGHTGVDPYATAVSDVYQDLFGEGSFTGKGLYDVDAFMAALDNRVPDNALLSHDLFEGLHARTALVSDVEVVDDYPTNVLAHAKRAHRWTRGDWQILWWLFPYVPSRLRLERNRLPVIARWKILDNLRRSLFAPSLMMLFVSGWTVLPGSPMAWTWLALVPLAWPVVLAGVEAATTGFRRQPLGVWASGVWDAIRTAAARGAIQLLFLAEDAYAMTHAIVVTLVRLIVTKVRLLEWETSADSMARARSLTRGAFYSTMRASPVMAGAIVALVAVLRPSGLLPAVLFAGGWAVAPLLGYWLSQPVFSPEPEPDEAERAVMRALAVKTWQFFATFANADEHHLPPDTVQVEPDLRVAHRTSPTNIAMGLLATLAARDLGFITTADMAERLSGTLSTIERLERFEGHLLNWYDTQSLRPLLPAYVSTVDSGNLAGALIALASGLRELAREPGVPPAVSATLQSLAARAISLVDNMNFRFLYDATRHLFAIGYRLADAEGPGQLDASFYDLLASEARLASFVAIAKGDVPQTHWFHLGRGVTSVSGQPVLLSWSGTLFEYLMPLLVMKSFPDTLLDASCRLSVRAQMDYGASRSIPWGFSESSYSVVDRHGNYQYKAFGVPTLGLKRGLGDELVVAPYATALATALDPQAAVSNLRRLARFGLDGDYGLFEAIDFTRREVTQGEHAPERQSKGTVVYAYLAHHQGMTLVALANALLGDVMVRRFHGEPRVQATELLLQERVPRRAVVARSRHVDETRAPATVTTVPARRYRSAHTPVPHAQFLSNGTYVTSVSNAGGGASVCRGWAVTRWRRDATLDPPGQTIYLRDVRSGVSWSAAYLPVAREPDEYLVTFLAERATFRRRDGYITTQLDIAVSTEDDVEVRRLTVHNHGRRARELDVTSYAEFALARQADDLAHPAFSKLFVDTEYVASSTSILCRRRRRHPAEPELWGLHVMSVEGRPHGQVEWETDRARFIGRGRTLASPVALDGGTLSGTTGVVLDPIASLRQRIRLAPGEAIRLSFSTGMAFDRDTALDLAQKYHDPKAASRVFALAYTHARANIHHLGITFEDARVFERLASRALHADRSLGATPDILSDVTLGQEGLWRMGISGDFPIVLLRLDGRTDETALVRQVLQAQEYWRLKGLSADVVILNEHPVSYLDDMHAVLTELLDNGPWRAWVHEPGGVFLMRRDELSEAERTLIAARARAVLHGSHGDLRSQVDRPPHPTRPPDAALSLPASESRTAERPGVPQPVPTLALSNGLGGFSPGGREFVIALEPNADTPVPWVNVIANPTLGTIVSASGSAFTWAVNSREHRLTPFANDPVVDPTGEAILIRDEDTGAAWSPTASPFPRQPDQRVVVGHAPGRTSFKSNRGTIRHRLDVCVDVDDPVKVSLLELTNHGTSPRRLSVYAYCEWWLSPPREADHLLTHTDYDESRGVVFAMNRTTSGFADRVAFLGASDLPRSSTGNREWFIGRNASLATAHGLRTETLSASFGAGLDPCACLQLSVELEPGQTTRIAIVLGEGRDRAEAERLVDRHRGLPEAESTFARVDAAWSGMLDTVQVKTPDNSFDFMMNSWLVYQTLSCRVHARSGYFQPGGAFGFRDQLQDVMALCLARPDIARAHILRAASRQFVEGDVQHWWHEPTGAGLRSRCSDDRLWLPFVVLHYVEVTGDVGVLDERVPFLVGAPLHADQEASYAVAVQADVDGTLYEHCVRAIDVSLAVGPHGLPLFGTGDWNDAMNLVGAGGTGESTWLGFFLYTILLPFAAVSAARGDGAHATRYRDEAHRLGKSLELAWDGEWYRRGYYDDGTPLGSRLSDECRIDALVQSWAVLSGAVPRQFAERALDSVRTHLVARGTRTILLLAPPFDRSTQEPGYIKGYPPGLRENGGQYTHAAAWFVMALARMGNGDEAMECFHMLNPINHSRSRGDVDVYKAEPYVLAGDVYANPQHPGRAGWSWYTGSAGWLYRAGLETLLGFKRRGDAFQVLPCLPSTWPGYQLTWRIGRTTYDITVTNPDRVCVGVRTATLDGRPVTASAVPILDDGATHRVEVTLGEAITPARGATAPADQLPTPVSLEH